MTLEIVEKILAQQSRVFSFENELVLHFAITLINEYGYKASDIYFEKSYDIEHIKQSNLEKIKKESFIDLIAVKNGIKTGFEFKYATVKLKEDYIDSNNMRINLKNQSGNDMVRFGFRKDIYRLEQLIKKKQLDKAFAVILTNDPNIIKTPNGENYLDKYYRFSDTVPISKEDKGWYRHTPTENHWTTKPDKDYKLDLHKEYAIAWKQSACEKADFKFCIVAVE